MEIKTLSRLIVCVGALVGQLGVAAAEGRPDLRAPGWVAQEPGERAVTTEPGERRTPAAAPDGPGWRIAFWITAATTVGLATGAGFSAALLQDLEDEKLQLITTYRKRTSDHYAFSGDDVCMEAQMRGDASEIITWCEDGESQFMTTYVLLGLTIAGTIATGALLYRAYFHRPSLGAKPEDESGGGAEHESLRFLITPSVGPRGGGLGLLLRF